MSKKHITIDVDVDAYSFDGGDGFTAEDLVNCEWELSSALDECLSDTEYATLVYITVKSNLINDIAVRLISSIGPACPDRLAAIDLIKARLADREFTNAVLEKVWR